MIRRVTRRTFISRFGGGTLAFAVFGLAACGDSSETGPASTATSTTGTATSAAPAATTTTPPVPATTAAAPAGDDSLSWTRVNLGFVSAYVLIRSGRAAIVDTGVGGSEASIEGALAGEGLGWAEVDHVILTHLHGDHVGSLGAVMEAAGRARGYAGAADLDGISAPRDLTPVGDGDEVLGLQILQTPGHTPGHISVFDPGSLVLVAGDALNGQGGGVTGPNPQFTPDMSTANESAGKLAALGADTLLFGHGEPVISGGAAALDALVAES